jgi:arabinose-5-phosphate isomerase
MSQKIARKVLRIEAAAISSLIPRIGDSFDQAVETLARCKGRVVTTGMGKSGIVCRKIAATLSSTGTPAVFVHPAEARHGDVGMLAKGDVVLLVSNSGETEELVQLLETIKRLGLPLISMIGSKDSTITRDSDLVLDIGVDQEACSFGLAPTASTTAALALGDALAIALSEKKGFRPEEFARLHPGGKLGKKLARVEELMHTEDQVPRVAGDTGMEDVIYEMSRKGLGVTAVVDRDEQLQGVISDGDLRRLLQIRREEILSLSAEKCMTSDPITIGRDELATKALHVLEENKITSLMVTDPTGKLIGVIHLHDLWGTEMF